MRTVEDLARVMGSTIRARKFAVADRQHDSVGVGGALIITKAKY